MASTDSRASTPSTEGVRTGALLELILWLGLAGAVWALTADFGDSPTTRPPAFDAAAWPRGVALIIGLVATGQFLARGSRTLVANMDEGRERSGHGALNLRLAAAFLVPLLYAFLLPRTGFFASTPVFFIAMVMVLGENRLFKAIVISLAVCGSVILIFTGVLALPLPIGTWPGFYEASSWLVEILR